MKQHLSSAATGVTEQSLLRSTLGGPNISCFTIPWWPAADIGSSHKRQKKCELNTSVKHGSLVVAIWNVRSLQGTGFGAWRHKALIACVFARYNIDILLSVKPDLKKWGHVTYFSGVAYTKISVIFVTLD